MAARVGSVDSVDNLDRVGETRMAGSEIPDWPRQRLRGHRLDGQRYTSREYIRPAFYDEERVDSLELGMKSDLDDDRNIIDVSARYTSGDGRWFVEAFGKNITRDEYYVARVRFSGSGAGWGLGNPGDPRAFGVTIGFEN